MKDPTIEDAEYFQALAEKLTLIPGFESPLKAALEGVAEALLENCHSRDQGNRVVTKAKRWERWRGVHGLLELIDADNPPAVPPNQAKDYGPRPPIDCPVCEDRGIVERNGEAQWCDCDFGQDQKAKYPNLIRDAKKKAYNLAVIIGARPEPECPRPLTEADIEEARRAKPDRTAEMIAQAERTLADQTASKDRQEIAREILRGIGPSREVN